MEAIQEIFRHAQGYPRRIATLCHDALEQLVILGNGYVDEAIIHGLIKQESQLLGQQHGLD
jgi:type II secretory pathway predicted ATPase ExeA